MNPRDPSNTGSFAIGSWAFSPAHGETVRLVDVDSVWNHTVCEVWIPKQGRVERVAAESLTPVELPSSIGKDRITYTVAAARIADALTQDVLLASLEAGVIPLPHQLYTLSRVMAGVHNLAALHKAGFVSAECKSKLDAKWSARHAYTGLDLAVPADRQALYDTAHTNLRLLGDLEQELSPSSLPQPGNATAQAKPHQDVPL